MSKKKKNKKNKVSFYKNIKPFIKDPRVLYSLLGAVGVGVALASVIGTDKGRSLVDKLTTALGNLGPDQNAASDTEPDQSATADKKIKQPKQFAVE